jgi:putative membrane protein
MTAMLALPASLDFTILADVDAVLNGLAFVFLCAALIAIKRGNVTLHKRLIFVTVGLSAAFLVCYLTYHYTVGSVPFTKTGWITWVYYPLLISHIVLAVVQVPLILRTLYLGLKDRREQHRKWAKVTTPIWLYVSITGVIVYVMLYRM